MTRLFLWMVPSFVLAVMGNGANAADGCSPGAPISVSLTPTAVVTCCGTQYTITLDAYDNDDCNDPPFKDYLAIAGWPGPVPVRGVDGHYRATLTRSHAEPGDYSFTVTVSDNTTTHYANDPADASVHCSVKVIGSLRTPTISCWPLVYICDPSNNPECEVTVPQAGVQPAGTLVCLEAEGAAVPLDPVGGCGAGLVKVRALEPQCQNGQPSTAKFRGRYSLDGVTCFSPWTADVEVIQPTSVAIVGDPVIVEQTPQRYIIHYNMQIRDQCGRNWPGVGCLPALQISEWHSRCCTNHPEINIASGAGEAAAGAFVDMLSVWAPEGRDIPEDLFCQRNQGWYAESCVLEPGLSCIRYYNDFAEVSQEACPGPCNGETAPCENP